MCIIVDTHTHIIHDSEVQLQSRNWSVNMVPVKLNNKPEILINEAERFVLDHWPFLSPLRLKELTSYDSRTYLVECNTDNPSKYIFKISNAIESRDSRYFGTCVIDSCE